MQREVNEAVARMDDPQVTATIKGLENLSLYAATYRDALTKKGFSRTEAMMLVTQYLGVLYASQTGPKKP